MRKIVGKAAYEKFGDCEQIHIIESIDAFVCNEMGFNCRSGDSKDLAE